MGLFGKKKKEEEKSKSGGIGYKPPKVFEPTPEQQEWLQENVFRKCNAKKIVPENCDEIMTYIQTHYEYPLRQRLKNKTNEELKFINELMSSLAYFMDSQDIF